MAYTILPPNPPRAAKFLPERLRTPPGWRSRPALPNVGGWERGARIGVGLAAMLAAEGARPGWDSAVFAFVAAVGLLTGFSRYCPVNRLVGRDSFKAPFRGARFL